MFKHVLLTRLLTHLKRKPTPFRYIDTHAGLGWYDLDSDEARRGGEWQDGIGRLDVAAAPDAVRALLAPYLEAVGLRDAAGRPGLYPGSPAIAQHMLRPEDRMALCELHPTDAETLRDAMGRDARIAVALRDGYQALKAFLPPRERRGLVLIDPPFEQRSEFDDMVAALVTAHRRWPTGVYALWYPIKDREALGRFATNLIETGIRRIAQVEMIVAPGAFMRGGLPGCGMILVNPPFGLAEEVTELMPFLLERLRREEPASWRWRSLVEE